MEQKVEKDLDGSLNTWSENLVFVKDRDNAGEISLCEHDTDQWTNETYVEKLEILTNSTIYNGKDVMHFCYVAFHLPPDPDQAWESQLFLVEEQMDALCEAWYKSKESNKALLLAQE